MSGGGSILAMVTSYRNNRNLLKQKKKMFDSAYEKTASDDVSSSGVHGELEIKHLSEEELAYFRDKTIKAHRSVFLIRIIVSIILFGFIGLGLTALIDRIDYYRVEEAQREYVVKLAAYNEKIEIANMHLNRGEYATASYCFKQAIKILSNKLEAKQLLAGSYMKSCMNDDLYCYELINFLNETIEDYPDNLILRELRATYYLSIGEEQKALVDLDMINEE